MCATEEKPFALHNKTCASCMHGSITCNLLPFHRMAQRAGPCPCGWQPALSLSCLLSKVCFDHFCWNPETFSPQGVW